MRQAKRLEHLERLVDRAERERRVDATQAAMEGFGVWMRMALEQRAEDRKPLVRHRRSPLAASLGETAQPRVDIGMLVRVSRGHGRLKNS